ncbi:hypothetical protein ABPG72_017322 [Tetrahymena utriculariae]
MNENSQCAKMNAKQSRINKLISNKYNNNQLDSIAFAAHIINILAKTSQLVCICLLTIFSCFQQQSPKVLISNSKKVSVNQLIAISFNITRYWNKEKVNKQINIIYFLKLLLNNKYLNKFTLLDVLSHLFQKYLISTLPYFYLKRVNQLSLRINKTQRVFYLNFLLCQCVLIKTNKKQQLAFL